MAVVLVIELLLVLSKCSPFADCYVYERKCTKRWYNL